jgi:hypothetical protein
MNLRRVLGIAVMLAAVALVIRSRSARGGDAADGEF